MIKRDRRRMLRQWWADNALRWRVCWHIVFCKKGDSCPANYYLWWTGGSFQCAEPYIKKNGCVRRWPHQC